MSSYFSMPWSLFWNMWSAPMLIILFDMCDWMHWPCRQGDTFTDGH